MISLQVQWISASGVLRGSSSTPASATAKEDVIIWQLRLPVALMAITVGAMLGAAGAEMQTILNNPLADPFTLGLSSAASFGAALAIVLGWSILPGVGYFFITMNAFIMAMLASCALFLFTRLQGVTPEAMVLMGIAMLFTFNALLTFLQYGASEMQLAQLIFWQLGSLSRATWAKVGVCAATLMLVLPYFISRSWALTALRMGEDKAAALGVNISLLRLTVLAGVSLLSAISVLLCRSNCFCWSCWTSYCPNDYRRRSTGIFTALGFGRGSYPFGYIYPIQSDYTGESSILSACLHL